MRELKKTTINAALAQMGIAPEALGDLIKASKAAEAARLAVLEPLVADAKLYQDAALKPVQAADMGATTLWNQLTKIMQATIDNGFDPETVVNYVERILGDIPKGTQYQTVKNYRSQFKRTLIVLSDSERKATAFAAIEVTEKDDAGNETTHTLDVGTKAESLSLGMARAITKADKNARREGDAALFTELVAELGKALRTAAKPQTAQTETDNHPARPALNAVPLTGDSGLIETVKSFIALVPERTPVAAPQADGAALVKAAA